MMRVTVVEAINEQKLLIDIQLHLVLQQMLLETIQVVLIRKIDVFTRFLAIMCIAFIHYPIDQILCRK